MNPEFTRRRLSLATLALAAGPSVPAREAAWPVFGPDRYGQLMHLRGGQPDGLLVDLLRRTETLSGDQFHLELTDWARALRLAELGQGGLLAVSRTAARESWLEFSKPCWVDRLWLVVRATDAVDFRRLSDLSGLRISMARGTTGGPGFDAAEAAGQLKVMRDAQSAISRLQALMAGRVDAVVASDGPRPMQELLAQARAHAGVGSPTPELRVLPRPLLSDALHLAFPKSMGAGAVLARFNQALERLGHPPATD